MEALRPPILTCRAKNMRPSLPAQRPARPVPIHVVSPSDWDNRAPHAMEESPDERAARRARANSVSASSQARAMDEPLTDWQVFTLLGGTAGGLLTLGIAGLYGLSLLLQ